MLKWWYRLFIELTNSYYLSRTIKRFAESKKSGFLVASFARTFKINQGEMVNHIGEYSSLHDFFIRELKPGSRMVDESIDSVVSPVDGVIEDFGVIRREDEWEVKQKPYTVEEMLSDSEALERYVGGRYIILYLSPGHYHRIHSPVTGLIKKQWTLGAKSYPVNKWGVKYGKNPLSKNFRRITEVSCKGVNVAIVKVGAMFINTIELTHESGNLVKGREMAYFSFGSTVVLLFEKEGFTMDSSIYKKMDVKLGQKLGTLKATPSQK